MKGIISTLQRLRGDHVNFMMTQPKNLNDRSLTPDDTIFTRFEVHKIKTFKFLAFGGTEKMSRGILSWRRLILKIGPLSLPPHHPIMVSVRSWHRLPKITI